jgi:hypothetical protein
MSFTDDPIAGTFQDYVASPVNQLNLGWTVTSLLFTLPVLVGLLIILYSLIQFLYNENYIDGSSPKTNQIRAMWVGFGMIIFGFFGAIYNFSKVVGRINLNVKVYGVNSLFQVDNSLDVIEGTRRQIKAQQSLETIFAKNKRSEPPQSAYAESPEQIAREAAKDTERELALRDAAEEQKQALLMQQQQFAERNKRAAESDALKAQFKKSLEAANSQSKPGPPKPPGKEGRRRRQEEPEQEEPDDEEPEVSPAEARAARRAARQGPTFAANGESVVPGKFIVPRTAPASSPAVAAAQAAAVVAVNADAAAGTAEQAAAAAEAAKNNAAKVAEIAAKKADQADAEAEAAAQAAANADPQNSPAAETQAAAAEKKAESAAAAADKAADVAQRAEAVAAAAANVAEQAAVVAVNKAQKAEQAAVAVVAQAATGVVEPPSEEELRNNPFLSSLAKNASIATNGTDPRSRSAVSSPTGSITSTLPAPPDEEDDEDELELLNQQPPEISDVLAETIVRRGSTIGSRGGARRVGRKPLHKFK